MKSYLESTARERIRLLMDAGSFEELLPPARRITSPHLAQLDANDAVILTARKGSGPGFNPGPPSGPVNLQTIALP